MKDVSIAQPEYIAENINKIEKEINTNFQKRIISDLG